MDLAGRAISIKLPEQGAVLPKTPTSARGGGIGVSIYGLQKIRRVNIVGGPIERNRQAQHCEHLQSMVFGRSLGYRIVFSLIVDAEALLAIIAVHAEKGATVLAQTIGVWMSAVFTIVQCHRYVMIFIQ